MAELNEGMVVICSTGQAGTVVQNCGRNVWILLRNLDVWTGLTSMCRIPQDQADLDSAPIDIERLESKRIIVNRD